MPPLFWARWQQLPEEVGSVMRFGHIFGSGFSGGFEGVGGYVIGIEPFYEGGWGTTHDQKIEKLQMRLW